MLHVMAMHTFLIVGLLSTISNNAMQNALDSKKISADKDVRKITQKDLDLYSEKNREIKELFNAIPALRGKCVRAISRKDGAVKVCYANIGLREIVFNYLGPDLINYASLESPELTGGMCCAYAYTPVLDLQFVNNDTALKAIVRHENKLLRQSEQAGEWNINSGKYAGNITGEADYGTPVSVDSQNEISATSGTKIFYAHVKNPIDPAKDEIGDSSGMSQKIVTTVYVNQTQLLSAICNALEPIKPYLTRRERERIQRQNTSVMTRVATWFGMKGVGN